MIPALFVAFLALLVLAVPVPMALVLAAAAAILASGGQYGLGLIPQQLFGQSHSFPLLAIPLFVLAGGIMGRGGMSERLIQLARALVGNLRGGLAIVAVVASMLFAAVSGSTAATVASIGIVMMPAVIRSGFSPGSATALQATAGSIGIIIPPSVPLVLMGVIGGVSIGDLFLGGVFPGVLIGAALIVAAHVIARVQGHEKSGGEPGLRRLLLAFLGAVPSLMTVVVVIGGIIGGFVTPTEAAVLAVLWSLLVCAVCRSLAWRDLYAALVDTVKITGIVVICIGASAPFAWLLAVEQVPQAAGAFILGLTENPAALKLLMLLVLLAIGTFLDLTPAMIILTPILFPIAAEIGMDPVHFGVVMVMALGIGQCTPPVGIALFVSCSLSRVRMEKVVLPLLPYLAAMLVALLIGTFWPPLITWLPDTLLGAEK